MPTYPTGKIVKVKKAFETKPRERSDEYNTRQWRKLRASILMDEPLCRGCKLAVATVIDHIKAVRSGGEFWDLENLQPLCKRCHNSKSGRENKLTPYGVQNPNPKAL